MGIKRRGKGRGQSLTEMAMVAPIFLLLVFGVFEFGRIVFIYSATSNASREAARYGASTGSGTGGVPRYLDCAAIRAAAQDAAILVNLAPTDIQIAYDTPSAGGGMTVYGHCNVGGADITANDVKLGDRIVVTVTRTIGPIISLVPIPDFSPSFVTARSILKDIAIGPTECSDGKDNDNDSDVDYPADSGCDSPDDTIEAICYRLAVTTNPADGGSVGINPGPNCANRYIEETVVDPLEAFVEPNSRYVFKNWTGDVITTTTNPITVTMDSDKDIVANFRLLTADLEVIKEGLPETVGVLEPLTYTINLTNFGPDPANTVFLTDTLPAGISFRGVFTDSWSHSGAGSSPKCSYDGASQVVCTLDPLPASTAIFTFDMTAPGTPGTITNTATTSAFEFDPPGGASNTVTETTNVIPLADVEAVSKTDSLDPVEAGSAFSYAIVVQNNGPSPATGVTITDTLPSGVEHFQNSEGCPAPAPGVPFICDLGNLAVGESRTVGLDVIAPDEGGVITNTVTVGANETDRDSSNNSGSEDTTILAADLGIVKSGGGAWIRDQQYSYVIDVTNFGPSVATNVVVSDTLPSGIDYDASSITTDTGSCGLDGSLVTCNLGDMADGATAQITINVTPTINSGTITNKASVTSARPEGNNSNANIDSETSTVSTDVNLSLTKARSHSTVEVGDAITYTLTVDHSGQSDARDVQIKDTLPVSVTYASASTGCSESSGVVTCNAGTLTPLASRTFEIVVTAALTGTARNEATASDADEIHTVTSNEVETVITESTTLSAPPDISGRFAWRGVSFRRWRLP